MKKEESKTERGAGSHGYGRERTGESRGSERVQERGRDRQGDRKTARARESERARESSKPSEDKIVFKRDWLTRLREWLTFWRIDELRLVIESVGA